MFRASWNVFFFCAGRGAACVRGGLWRFRCLVFVVVCGDFARRGTVRYRPRAPVLRHPRLGQSRGARGFRHPRLGQSRGPRGFRLFRLGRSRGPRGFRHPRLGPSRGARAGFGTPGSGRVVGRAGFGTPGAGRVVGRAGFRTPGLGRVVGRAGFRRRGAVWAGRVVSDWAPPGASCAGGATRSLPPLGFLHAERTGRFRSDVS